MPNRYDDVMARLPHDYMVRVRADALPPPAGPAFVRVEKLDPVPESALVALETRVGSPLPADYREFLRQYGDAAWRRTYFRGEPAISYMYGVRPTSAVPLAEYWPPDIDGMPSFFLPIASSVISEIVAISLGKDDYGQVFVRFSDCGYWDESKGDYEGVERFAESFHQLIIELIADDKVW